MLAPNTPEDASGTEWLKARIKRHVSELIRLSAPAVMTRVGLSGLAMVDVAMVGHYATNHLAWLNLANQSFVMFVIVVALGLQMGVIVYTANAFGRDDYEECGRVWRRTLPFSVVIGLIILVLALPAEAILLALGQPADQALEAGKLIKVLAYGLPFHVLFITCTMFLEGIKRPGVGFGVMIVANIVNAISNYALIYGELGMPEMGAVGSAWTSSIVRFVMFAGVFGYIWFSPTIQKFGVRNKPNQNWHSWSAQRQMGYASAVSLTSEVIAFAALAIFAGWIGTVPLAGHGVIYQVIGIPLMISIGIGVAASVRTGISFGRGDRADTLIAGVSGMVLTLLVVGVLGVVIYAFVEPIVRIFTLDERVVQILAPLAFIFTLGMIFDSMQMALSSILRGLTETWWPTALQTIAFVVLMLPASYIFAIPMEMGLEGLVYGTFVGVFASFTLQLVRYVYLMRRPLPTQSESS